MRVRVITLLLSRTGEIPSTKIFEDDHTYAFLDINPMNRGHTLVIPKFHSRDLLDLPDGKLHCTGCSKGLSPHSA